MAARVAGRERWIAWLGAALPVLVATARAVARGWKPIEDNALVAIRAGDVGTAHHPLLGTWSSASLEAGIDVNHPGPLLFDVLAVPVRLFGSDAGTALGVALVNVAAAAVVVVFARRCAGATGVIAATAAFGLVAWTMGSELLFDPWNPHVTMLPCVALFVAAWAVAAGDRAAVPVLLAVGSLCLQVHLGYAYLVPLLVVIALLLGWPAWRSRRTVGAGLLVLALLWAQPLWEQAFGAGQGNVSRLLTATGRGDAPLIGARLGIRIVAAVATQAPWRMRADFTDAVPTTYYTAAGTLPPIEMMGGREALLRLVALGVVLGAATVLAWRRRDRIALAALVIAGAGLVIGTASVMISPVGPLGLTAHQMRWLWPLTAWWWLAVVLVVLRALPPDRRRVGLGLAALAAVVLALANLPRHVQATGPAERAWQISIVEELDAQMGALEGRGVVLVDTSATPVFDAYTAAMMEELRHRGIPFRVDEEGLVRQLGERRRLRDDADLRMQLLYGAAALATPPGAERVAFGSLLGPGETRELFALPAALMERLDEDPPTLTPAGVAAQRAGIVPADALAAAPGELIGTGELAGWWADGYVDVPAAAVADLERYADLHARAAATAVAVVVGPMPGR